MSRSKKTNKTQMELLINFIENNRIVVTGKCHPMKTQELEEKWDELTEILNSAENGARKDKKQWKHFLYEWKSKTKKKARTHKVGITQTGGGGYISTDLSELENRLMGVMGWVHIIGCPGLPEEMDPEQRQEDEETTEEIDENQTEGNETQAYIASDGYLFLPPTSKKNPAEKKKHVSSSTKLEKSADMYRKEIDENQTEGNGTEAFVDSNEYLFLPPTTSKKNPAEKKKYVSSSTKLEKSAEMYSQSTEQMAVAVREMAAAICQLSKAISEMASAISKKQ